MNTVAVLHCSSDVNYFWQGSFFEVIPYQDLERKLPEFLVGRMKTHPFKTIVVINGPGGFSQLRIACLCVNLLKSHYPSLQIATRDKIQLGQEYYRQGVIPQYQIVHVGMKKKLRMVDLKIGEQTATTVATLNQEILNGGIEETSVDMMQDHLLLQEHSSLTTHMIAYELQNIGLVCRCHDMLGVMPWQQLLSSDHLVDYLEPQYMIAPQIG